MTEMFGRYRGIEPLGSGAFSTVWLAYDDTLATHVAIKVLADNWARDPEFRERFIREAQILWRSQSDHIIHVHTVEELEDGRPYFVMDHADRGSLADRMTARAGADQGWATTEVVAISNDIGAGLRDAHSSGIAHRDLKPSNVMFRSHPGGADGERLVLVDFGIAKDLGSAAGRTIATGTPHYMAPEQAEGRADQRSDIYSAGVIAYELLAGRVPYPYDSVSRILAAQASEPIPPISSLRSDVPAGLEQAISMALAVDPDERHQSVNDWMVALNAAGTTVTPPAPEAEPSSLPPPPMPPPDPAAAVDPEQAAETEQVPPPDPGATMGPEQFAATGEAPPEQEPPPQEQAPPPPGQAPPPPGQGPPGPYAMAGQPPPDDRRRRRRGLILTGLGVAAVLALIVGLVVALGDDTPDGPTAAEVFAEPVSSLGVDAFTDSIVPARSTLEGVNRNLGGLEPREGELVDIDLPEISIPELPLPELPDDDGEGDDDGGGDEGDDDEPPATTTATISGSTPGLFGGTNLLDVCNKDQLIDFLSENVEKGRAWAEVLGIEFEEIGTYIDNLTDVILQADTRVTNHGFRNGIANPINSILQAGTAVLVDLFGSPVVRCKCGNPLVAPAPLTPQVEITGTTWPGISIENTIVILPTVEVIEFVIDDVLATTSLFRLPGKPAVESTLVPQLIDIPGTSTTTTLGPTSTLPPEIVVGEGDVQATLIWEHDADMDLHVIDPDGTEIYYSNSSSPSGGELDLDTVPAGGDTGPHAENVFWPEDGAPPGRYEVYVNAYSGSGSYYMEVRVGGVIVHQESGSLSSGENSERLEFFVDTG